MSTYSFWAACARRAQAWRVRWPQGSMRAVILIVRILFPLQHLEGLFNAAHQLVLLWLYQAGQIMASQLLAFGARKQAGQCIQAIMYVKQLLQAVVQCLADASLLCLHLGNGFASCWHVQAGHHVLKFGQVVLQAAQCQRGGVVRGKARSHRVHATTSTAKPWAVR